MILFLFFRTEFTHDSPKLLTLCLLMKQCCHLVLFLYLTILQTKYVEILVLFIQCNFNYISKVVSSNLIHGEVYLIQHYVIKFVSDLQQVSGFLQVLVSSTNKTDCHNIIESGFKHHKP